MITLFATTKDFTGIYKTIQMNALKSWRSISNDIEIIIFGDSKGSKEAAEEVGAEYIPNVKCSDRETPLLSDLFQQADEKAKYSILTFINADIILPENFFDEVMTVSKCFNKFLMVGHRWDMDVDDIIEFENDNEQNNFWERVKINSEKHACSGIDYFVYKRNQWKKLPDFIIGRPGFDNWLIWKARRKLFPVIDGTESIQVVHQNHPWYQLHHRIKSKHNAMHHSLNKLYKIEGEKNKKLHNGKTLNILDASYRLFDGKVMKKKDKESKIRYLHRLPRIFPEIAILIKLYRRFYKRFILI